MNAIVTIFLLITTAAAEFPPLFNLNNTRVTRDFNYNAEPRGFGPILWNTTRKKLPPAAKPAGSLGNCTIYKWYPRQTVFSVKPQSVSFAIHSNKLVAVYVDLTSSNDCYVVFTNLVERYGLMITTIEQLDPDMLAQSYVWHGETTTITLSIANTKFSDRYGIEPYTLIFEYTPHAQTQQEANR
jgi:hypothetical protein